ncbi:g4177 [Coccomyxa viridis]|uniref:G4177 protein n=1 Tax=Coccomyxa viridis TaxID=1274662 RepID=A0ABP1FUQ3_9CHLO
MPIRIAAAVAKQPFSYKNVRRSGNDAFSGIMFDILPNLFGFIGLNATDYTIYPSPDQSSGYLLPDGSWTGLIGEVVSGRADIAVSQVTASATRLGYVDQSVAFVDAPMGLLAHASTERPIETWAFLEPFSWQLWLALAMTAFGVALVMVIAGKLSPLGTFDMRAMRRLDVPSSPPKEYVVSNTSKSHLLDAWMTATGQTALPQGRSWSNRFIGLCYGLFSFVIVASYTAALAARLTVQQRHYTITSLQDLADSGMPFVANSNGATKTYLDKCERPLIRQLAPRAVYIDDDMQAVEMVRNGTMAAYMTQLTLLQYLVNQQPCDMAIVESGWGYGEQVFALQKGSNLTAPLNNAIRKLQQEGTVDKVTRDWIGQGVSCFGVDSTLQSQQLQLGSFAGLFYMLLIFCGLAFVMVGLEKAVIRIGHRCPRLRAQLARLDHWVSARGNKHFDFSNDTFGSVKNLGQHLPPAQTAVQGS